MGCYIGAKDKLDKALVKQYAKVQTNNFSNNEKINPDDMWKMITMHSIQTKNFVIRKAS